MSLESEISVFETYAREMSKTSYPGGDISDWKQAIQLRQGIAESLKKQSEYPDNMDPNTRLEALNNINR
jgi:hypothetical protein